MSETIQLMVLDLSHYDVPCDLAKAKDAGIEGIIWKATQATNYFDNTYVQYRKKAEDAGLLWGSYHFAENGDCERQATWYTETAQIDEDDLFCLDWEPSKSQMTPAQARDFVQAAEDILDRPNECLIYGSSSFLTDQIPAELDAFFAARRLWLAQFGTTPKVPPTWKEYWLWQYAADGVGPKPWTVPGIPGNPDVNSFKGSADQLLAEWAHGTNEPPPEPPPPNGQPISMVLSISGLPAGTIVTIQTDPSIIINAPSNATLS